MLIDIRFYYQERPAVNLTNNYAWEIYGIWRNWWFVDSLELHDKRLEKSV
jgi:hypothetical protein